ncbi:hypothetical protein [Sphingobium yanoikuyae]|nr:hypothetical protein [Sphingobium yanoikuyae]
MKSLAVGTFYAVGVLTLIVGIYVTYLGVTLDVTLPSGQPIYDRIANLQLMHVQSVNIFGGIGLILIAIISLSTGAIISFLAPKDPD